MRKKITYIAKGHMANVGEISIQRMLPNQYSYHVGHFVFLDYVAPTKREEVMVPNVGGAHPHRGIATLTYVLSGEAEHYDSRGNRATVHSGGVQWMKAGNGIIHDEVMNVDSKSNHPNIQGFQFWINLPAKQKNEDPEYMAVQADDLPLIDLTGDAGSLKVVVGEYAGRSSAVPTYAKQYLYHIRLRPEKQFILPTADGMEYAIFLPEHDTKVNNVVYHKRELIAFEDREGLIEIFNESSSEIDVILFGGEKYTEPFVAQGPFVMGSREDIARAYEDYNIGKYGDINYDL